MKRLLTAISLLLLLFDIKAQQCTYNLDVVPVQCYGDSSGSITVDLSNLGCASSGCVTPEVLPQDYCNNCASPNSTDVNVGSGQKICLNAGVYNNINLNAGGELVICENNVSIGNISFNGGKLVINAVFSTSNISINSTATVIENYGDLTIGGFNFQGSFYNHGQLTVTGNMNVNGGNHYFENNGTVTFNNTFNNLFETVNNGTIEITNGDFHNNGSSKLTNNCTIIVGENSTGAFINDSEIHNYGTIRSDYVTRLNGNSIIYNHAGAQIATNIFECIDGDIIGDNQACSQVTVTGNTTINSSSFFDGNLKLCGIDLSTAPSGTVSPSVSEGCDCVPSTIEAVWADGFVGNSRINLPAGTYTFSASCDTCNLQDIEVVISQPDTLEADVTTYPISEEGVCDGSASLSIQGGTAPYTTTWSNGSDTTSGLCEGTNSVQITDNNGCSIDVAFEISEGDAVCDIDLTPAYSETVCEGNNNGYIELIKETSNPPYGEFTGCSPKVLPSEDYCAQCEQSYSGSYASISSGTACIMDGFDGHVDLNGGRLVVCGDDVKINSINFNGGEIIVLGSAELPNINMNNSASSITNYGTIRTTNMTFNGTLNNHGYLFVGAHFNVNDPQAHILNTGELIVTHNFVINATTRNEGFIHVVGEYFIINDHGVLDNLCTVLVGSDSTNFGRFITNGTFNNQGGLITGFNFRLNSGGIVNASPGSILSTYNIEMLDGTFNGPLSANESCAQLKIGGTTGYNSSMSITGNVAICGFDPSDFNVGNVASSVTSGCECISEDVMSEPDYDGYTFTWYGPNVNGAEGHRLDSLGAGVYTVIVTTESCTDTITVTIEEVENTLTTVLHEKEVSGDNECNNKAALEVVNGTAPLYFEWYLDDQLYRDGINDSVYTDLCRGEYLVVITDGNGCQQSHDFIIGSGSRDCESLEVTLDSNEPSCQEKADGTIWAFASGGTEPYTYKWNTGGQNDTVFFATQRYYEVVVTDDQFCKDTVSLDLQALQDNCDCADKPVLTASITRMPSCDSEECDGEIELSAYGGMGALSYVLNDEVITELTQTICAETQYAKVLDTRLCVDEITESGVPSCEDSLCNGFSVHIDTDSTECPEKATGSATVTISGGVAPYIMSWNHGDLESTNHPVHYYNQLGERRTLVQVEDQNGCMVSDTNYVVASNDTCTIPCADSIKIDFSIEHTPCESQKKGVVVGIIDFPYTSPLYYWNDQPSPDLTLSELAKGSYRLRVVDEVTGCFEEEVATVNADDDCNRCDKFKVDTSAVTEGLCSGAGTVTLSATAGFGPYEVTIDGVDKRTYDTDVFVVDRLSAGRHQIEVLSADNCSRFIDVALKGNGATPLVIEPINIKPETCSPGEDGEIILSYHGGTGNLTTSWSDLGASDLTIRTGLTQGEYVFTLEDETGCSISDTFKVGSLSENIKVAETVIDAASPDSCTGSIIIDELAYGMNLSYDWSNINDDTSINDSLCAGYYTLTITDAISGCKDYYGFHVGNKPCDGDNIEIETAAEDSPGAGGSASIVVTSCDPDAQDDCDLKRDVIDIADAYEQGCDRFINGNANVNVENGERVCVDFGATFSGGLNVNSGSLLIFGQAEFNNLNNNDAVENYGIVSGNYINNNITGTISNYGAIDVTGFNNNNILTNLGDIIVEQPFENNADGYVNNQGSLVSGGFRNNGNLDNCGKLDTTSSDVDTEWPDSTCNGSLTCDDIPCGVEQSVLVTLPNGESYTEVFIIDCYKGIYVKANPVNGGCNGLNGRLEGTVSGGSGNYSFSWENTETDQVISTDQNVDDVLPGSYQLTVTDNQSNETKPSEVVAIVDSPELTIKLSASPTGLNASTGSVSSQITGGTGFATYSYLWTSESNPSFEISQPTRAEIFNLEEGIYRLTVTDENDCPVSDTAHVLNNGTTPDPNCTNVSATASGVEPSSENAGDGYAVVLLRSGVSYTLAEGEVNEFSYGGHSLDIIITTADGFECPKTVNFEIPRSSTPDEPVCTMNLEIDGENSTCPGEDDGWVEAIVTNADRDEYYVAWTHDFLEQETLLENVEPGRYEVTITHKTIDDCQFIDTITITEPLEPRVYAANFEICPGEAMEFRSNYYRNVQWSEVNGSVLSEEPVVTIDQPGDYLFEVTNNPNNCTGLSVEFTIDKRLDCPDDTGSVFCEPYRAPKATEISSCEEELVAMAMHTAQYKYRRYLEEERRDFQREYIKKCLASQEELTTEYQQGEYHYTLYYYDQAGNLVRTVPPAGVEPINDRDSLDQIALDRENGTRNVFTDHSYKTTYTYNSLNQLIAQNVPDHETMEVFDASDYSNGLSTNNVTSVQVDAQGNGFITAQDNQGNGYLYSTNDYGNTWTPMSSLGLVSLYDVQIVDNNVAVAVGSDGTFVRSVDGGQQWLAYPVGTAAEFRFVHFTDAQNGRIWTTSGELWSTVDGGTSWTEDDLNLGQIRDIRFNDPLQGTMVTKRNGISELYTSDDGGSGWQLKMGQNLPLPILKDLQILNNNTLVGVGDGGLIIKSENQGVSWQLIGSRNNLNFSEIHFNNATSATAFVGNNLYVTSNGGTIWNQQTSLTNVTFAEIQENGEAVFLKGSDELYFSRSKGASIINQIDVGTGVRAADAYGLSMDIVAAALIDDRILMSYNSGNQWYNLTAFESVHSSPITVKQVHITNEQTVLVLAQDGTTYRTTNAKAAQAAVITNNNTLGAQWTDFTIAVGKSVEAFHFNNDLSGYAIMNDGSVYTTTDGGTAWTMSSPAINNATEIHQKSGITTALISGVPYVYNGSTWQERNTTLSTQYVTSADRRGNDVVAVGDYGVSISSANGGTNWQYQTVPSKTNLSAVSVSSGGSTTALNHRGEVWNLDNLSLKTDLQTVLDDVNYGSSTTELIVGADGKVYKSNGTSLAQQTTGITDDLHAVEQGSVYSIAVGEGGKILRWNGSAWECVTMVDPLALNATDMVDDGTGYGVGARGTVVKTTNAGQNWINQNSTRTQDLNAVWAIDYNRVVAVGNNGTIIRTTNGGEDHFNKAVDEDALVNLYDLQFISSTIGLTVGDNGNVHRTFDGGVSWSEINTSFATNLKALHFVSRTYGFVGGTNGEIHLYDESLPNNPWVNRRLSVQNTSGLRVDVTEEISDIHFVDNRTGYAATTSGNVYKTTDAGENWALSTAGNGAVAGNTQLYFQDAHNFFVLGQNGVLNKVRDETNLYTSRFWYDRLGRLVASQNQRQYSEDKYSYTVYDSLGRVAEVGELEVPLESSDIASFVEPGHNSQFQYDEDSEEDYFLLWLQQTTNIKREVNLTQYDVAVADVPGLKQKHLRNRVASAFYYEVFGEDYTSATHYSYDIHGNVQTLVQDFPDLAGLGQQYKRLDYVYDLVSGNVNEVQYQKGKADQFFHRYAYDADNRITKTETSRDYLIWDTDATSKYYKHGPLARMEIGNDHIQAMDYVYTIHGWLKGVNATSLNENNDPGKDGRDNNFAKDEMAYSLSYYDGDYSAINQPDKGLSFLIDKEGSDLNATQKNLYNGNISQMVTGIRKFMRGDVGGVVANNYTYDQLNRLKTSRTHISTTANATNRWGIQTATEDYAVDLSYDPNGNILSLKRNGTTIDGNELKMDRLVYVYENKKNDYDRNTNKLRQVTDAVDASNYDEDIDTQEAENYVYDATGNLVRDNAEGLSIEWNVQNKVRRVTHDPDKGDDLEFVYNAMGERIVKIVKPRTTDGLSDQGAWKYTYYVRDASGNVMSTYTKKYSELTTDRYLEELKVDEFHLYGSSRLGVMKLPADQQLIASNTLSIDSINTEGYFYAQNGTSTESLFDLTAHYVGNKYFEASNHLGNVLVAFNDRKIANTQDQVGVSGYEADVVSASNYYPFGMLMPGMKMDDDRYRYGFNGMEKDDEVKGSGNSYTTEFRQLDPRLGRWLSPDPVIKVHESPYAWNTNNPIVFVDVLGADSTQRANAISKAEQYVAKNDGGNGNTYGYGSKGAPGEKVDCSGLVSACMKAGGESDPVADNSNATDAIAEFGKDGGARRIAANSTEITDYKQLQPGNIILLDNGSGTGSHIGIITKIELNEDGTIKNLNFIDSGGQPSKGKSGPRNSVAYVNGTKKYWGKHIDGFYKWDTKPDKPKLKKTTEKTVKASSTTSNPATQGQKAQQREVQQNSNSNDSWFDWDFDWNFDFPTDPYEWKRGLGG